MGREAGTLNRKTAADGVRKAAELATKIETTMDMLRIYSAAVYCGAGCWLPRVVLSRTIERDRVAVVRPRRKRCAERARAVGLLHMDGPSGASWAAYAIGSSSHVLKAVRASHPSVLRKLHDFVISVQRAEKIGNSHLQLHALLDAECAAITTDAAQQQRVHDALEKLATTQLHSTVFGRGEGDAEAEQTLEAALREARSHLTPAMLGVAPAFADGAAWATPALLLRRLERYRAPADKVALIVNACRLIERRMHVLSQQPPDGHEGAEPPPITADEAGQLVVGADEFFPVLLYVLLIAAPPTLPSELAYISRFRHPSRLRGVSGCYFTHVRAALEFLEHGRATGWGHESLKGRAPPPLPAPPQTMYDEHEPPPMSAAQAWYNQEPPSGGGAALSPSSDTSGRANSWREWLFAPTAAPQAAPQPASQQQPKVAIGSVFGGFGGVGEEVDAEPPAPPPPQPRLFYPAEEPQPPARREAATHTEDNDEPAMSSAAALGFY